MPNTPTNMAPPSTGGRPSTPPARVLPLPKTLRQHSAFLPAVLNTIALIVSVASFVFPSPLWVKIGPLFIAALGGWARVWLAAPSVPLADAHQAVFKAYSEGQRAAPHGGVQSNG